MLTGGLLDESPTIRVRFPQLAADRVASRNCNLQHLRIRFLSRSLFEKVVDQILGNHPSIQLMQVSNAPA